MNLKYYPTMSNGWVMQILLLIRDRYPEFEINPDAHVFNLPPDLGTAIGFFYELIPGNLTVAFEESFLKARITQEMMALPVNDIYILRFNDSQQNNSFIVGNNEKVFSGKGNRTCLFSSTTTTVTFIHEPNHSFRSMHLYISRAYLMQLIQQLDLPRKSKWWQRLRDNESFCNSFDLLLSDFLLEDEMGEKCYKIQGNESLNIHLLMLNIQRLLVLFLERIFKTEIQEVKTINRVDYNKIQKTTEMIRLELHKKYGLVELADKCDMSISKFKRTFKIVTKKSLSDYYYQVRMEDASKQLAENVSDNMIEIALKLGYKDQSQFSKAFKEYFGYPPSLHAKIVSSNN